MRRQIGQTKKEIDREGERERGRLLMREREGKPGKEIYRTKERERERERERQ